MEELREIKSKFKNLPSHLQAELLDELLQSYELTGQIITQVREELSTSCERKPCPHCHSPKVYKRGKKKGVQMFQCRDCTKWFNETTGTPLWDIKLKHKWQSYLRCMQQGMSIRKSAKEVGISIQTSFDWRHKILSSLDSFTPKTLSGVIEADEMELPINEKGNKHLKRKPRKRSSDFKRNRGSNTVVQVVTCVERSGEKMIKAVETKRLTTEHIEKVFEQRIKPGATLITDNHVSYKGYGKKNPAIKHKTFHAKEHVSKKDSTIHLQKVNNTHNQLRKFLRNFNGVSTKYIQNYLNWYAYADKLNQNKETIKQWIIQIFLSKEAYELFWLFKENAVIIRT